jgi:hypothetical protein
MPDDGVCSKLHTPVETVNHGPAPRIRKLLHDEETRTRIEAAYLFNRLTKENRKSHDAGPSFVISHVNMGPLRAFRDASLLQTARVAFSEHDTLDDPPRNVIASQSAIEHSSIPVGHQFSPNIIDDMSEHAKCRRI